LALATSTTNLDVDGRDAKLLTTSSHVLSGKHGGIWRGLVAIGLDLHATSHTDESLAAGEIGDVDESVVVRRIDVCDTKDDLVSLQLLGES